MTSTTDATTALLIITFISAITVSNPTATLSTSILISFTELKKF